MLSQVYDLYNVDRIIIYVIKVNGQDSSPLSVETQERCIFNLNKKYTSHGRNNTDLHLRDDASNGPMRETTRIILPSVR